MMMKMNIKVCNVGWNEPKPPKEKGKGKKS